MAQRMLHLYKLRQDSCRREIHIAGGQAVLCRVLWTSVREEM